MKKKLKIIFKYKYGMHLLITNKLKNLFVTFLIFLFSNSIISADTYSMDFPQKVNFHYYIGILKMNGYLRVEENSFFIDFKNPEKSKINLQLDIKNSDAGFPLATYLMKSPEILNTDNHPFGYFESTNIKKKKIFS